MARRYAIGLAGAMLYGAIVPPLGSAVRNSRDIARCREMDRYFAKMNAESAARPKPRPHEQSSSANLASHSASRPCSPRLSAGNIARRQSGTVVDAARRNLDLSFRAHNFPARRLGACAANTARGELSISPGNRSKKMAQNSIFILNP